MELLNKIRKSFKYAWSGLIFFLTERNIKIHIFVSLTTIIFGFYFSIKPLEWVAIIFCVSLVLALEIINTVIEEVIDFVCAIRNGKAMIIKDLAAASVLIAAIGSMAIGVVIFYPYIIKLLQ